MIYQSGSYNYISIQTDKDLGGEAFVRSLLLAWTAKIDPSLRPEFFNPWEPIRRSIEKEGVEAAIRLWLDNQMPVYLRRKTKPKFEVNINWRPEKGLDPRPYPWGCSVWLHRSAEDALAITLFRFLVDHFEPAFGSITTDEDSDAKHFITFEDRGGRAEMYRGGNVMDILPGVYWLTYFGPGAMKVLKRRSLANLKAHRVEPCGQGYLVWAYESVKEAGSASAREAEGQILDQLGRDRFFDKDLLDIESLKTDEFTAAMIEKKVQEKIQQREQKKVKKAGGENP